MEIWRYSEKQMAAAVDDALALTDDAATLAALELLTGNWHFGQLVGTWGPALYRRNRAAFLGFLEIRVDAWSVHRAEAWRGWIDEVDAAGDTTLFRRLYQARIMALGDDAWHDDLDTAWAAGTTAARAAGLGKYALRGRLPRIDVSLRFYREDPDAARPWLLAQCAGHDDPGALDDLIDAATAAGDADFADALFARNQDEEAWKARVELLSNTVTDGVALAAALDRIHPVLGASVWANEEHYGRAPDVLLDLARTRDDIAPWLRRHHADFPFGGAWTDLSDLAFERRASPGWFKLWIALGRAGRGHGFNSVVKRAIDELGADAPRALFELGGATQVWEDDFGATRPFWRLDTVTFAAVLRGAPTALLGPLRPHVQFGQIDTKAFNLAVKSGREELIDLVTARQLTAHPGWGPRRADPKKILEYWRALPPSTFVPRALRVLGFLESTTATWRSYAAKNHALRQFFLDPAQPYLDRPGALRELLEAPSSCARQLGLAAVRHRAGDVDRDLRPEVLASLDILLGYLFFDGPSRDLRDVIFALRITATTATNAAAIATSVRDALALHQGDEGSLRARDLLGSFLAELLVAWPQLRRPSERPVIYRRQA